MDCNFQKLSCESRLRLFKFQNLIRFLDRSKKYLSDVCGFEYDGQLETTFDYGRLAEILRDGPCDADTDFFTAMSCIGAIGTESRREILWNLAQHTEGVAEQLEPGMPAEDLALLLCLDAPHQWEALKTQVFQEQSTHCLNAIKADGESICCCDEFPEMKKIMLRRIKYRDDNAPGTIMDIQSDDVWRHLREREISLTDQDVVLEADFKIFWKSGEKQMLRLKLGTSATYDHNRNGLAIRQWLSARELAQTNKR